MLVKIANGLATDLVALDTLFASTDYIPASAITGVYIGVAGNIKIDTDTQTALTVPVIAGQNLLVHIKKIYHSGTTASSIFAFVF